MSTFLLGMYYVALATVTGVALGVGIISLVVIVHRIKTKLWRKA